MRIISTDNRCNIMFGASSVTLKNIDPMYLQRYKEIQKLAKEDNLDIFISKSPESEYLDKNDLYTIVAKKDIPFEINEKGGFGLPAHSTDCVLTDKNASAKEVSDKLYETVVSTIEGLAKNIEKRLGEKPNFLKYLKK